MAISNSKYYRLLTLATHAVCSLWHLEIALDNDYATSDCPLTVKKLPISCMLHGLTKSPTKKVAL